MNNQLVFAHIKKRRAKYIKLRIELEMDLRRPAPKQVDVLIFHDYYYFFSRH